MRAVKSNSKFTVTGHTNIMELLIENGANINAVNNDNESALIKALLNGNFSYSLNW